MLNLINETWIKITHIHEVSNLGNIRSINGKQLKPWISTTGYYNIKVIEQGKRINKKLHRLICKAFNPNPLNKPDVNHIDGNKLNNVPTNLEWCTHAENMSHASKNGLIDNKPRTLGQKLSNTSSYHNVGWDKTRSKWIAGITHNKKSLGKRRFECEEDAALYVNFLLDLHGLFDRPRNVINKCQTTSPLQDVG